MPAIANHYWLLLLCMLTLRVTYATQTVSLQPPTHSNFLRSAMLGGRQKSLLCTDNPQVCTDREKNPWGGDTCCFQHYCKDTSRDRDHCGGCGRRCAYGMLCCGGRCIDIRADRDHCGSCYSRCAAEIRCRYGMCGYGAR